MLCERDMVNIKVRDDKELIPFQATGIDIMVDMHRNNQNILLGDEMGLGKTVQVCCFINAINEAEGFKKVLIICPNNLKYVWKHHVEDWVTKKYDMEVAGSTLFMWSDFVIINYEALKNYQDALGSIEWDLIVGDEAHYLKNPSSLRSKIVYSSLKAKRWVFVTGTPIVNYPYEIFPLIHHLDRESWPNYSSFEFAFTSGSQDKFGKNLTYLQNVLVNGSNGEPVKNKYGSTIYRHSVKPILIRRLKKDVLPELPKKRRQVIELPNDTVKEIIKREKELHEGAGKDFMDELNALLREATEGGRESVTDEDFEGIIESLKHNKRYLFEEMAKIRHILGRAKVPFVTEHLENVLDNEEKVIVFYHHHDVGSAIYNKFKDKAVIVDGTVSMEERDARIQRFQNDPNCLLFVGSMSVVGLGLTLTAAAHGIFAETDWVPGKLTQAEDRMHRIGQMAESILIQHMVFEDSMDAYMIKRVIRKQKSINLTINAKGVSTGL